jgi:outer membrane protein assembly factor BamB
MRKRFLIVGFFLLAAILLSGCTGSTVWPGLSASGEVAYLANTSAIHAIDLKTGQELWKFTGQGGGFLNTNPSLYVTTPIVTEDGLLIVLDSGNKHILYAVDTKDINQDEKTPNIAWRFSEADGHWIAPPLIVGNRLFAPNSDGKVYVLDLQDGQSEKQALKVVEPFSSNACSGLTNKQPGRLWAQPVTDGNLIFVTSLDHSLFAIDPEAYNVVWCSDLGGAIPSAPALGSDGMLYVGSFAKKLERFDPATGQHTSVLDSNNWIWGTPVVDGDNLYFSDVDGFFYSYNTKDNKLNWEPVKPDSAITASPLVLGDQVLIATESGEIYTINGNGKPDLWFQGPEKGKAYTTPVSAGDYVLAAYIESDYYLVALDAEGDVKWTFPTN